MSSSAPERRTISVGSLVGPRHDVLNLGPHHPSMHGLMRLHLEVATDTDAAGGGERVVAADPEIGFVHRGAEKLFEMRDYRQLLTLANRHDWLSAFAGELGVALAVEDLLGITVPERAVWARTLLAELTRVFSHLTFLRSFPSVSTMGPAPRPPSPRAPASPPETSPPRTPPPQAWGDPALGVREIDAIQAALERYSGGRLHVAATRIGGLHHDLDKEWLDDLPPLLSRIRALVEPFSEVLLTHPSSAGSRPGVGTLDPAVARAFGASGPVARACGVDLDLRRDDPYLAYGELFSPGGPGRVVTEQGGDVRARLSCLLQQLEVSLELVAATRARLLELPPGPVGVRLPKTVRVPEGETYVRTETPLGIAGFLLVSRGGRTPWRLKLRSPSFAHLSLLPELLPGTAMADVGPVLASLCYILGDADR